MTLWRLEWLRLVRTRRWVALVGVYVYFGLIGPLTARYLGEIVGFAGGELEGAVIQFPPATPQDGIAQYVSNAMQIGTLVAVVVAAGALAFDAVPEMGVFLRTRVRSLLRVLTPRLAVTTVAIAASFSVGVAAAWYETWVLIGSVDGGGMVLGTALAVVFLAFVVALVAAVAGRARTVLSTVLISIVVLLIMPIIGLAEAVGRWLPTHLSTALIDLSGGGSMTDYWPALAVTVLLIAGLLWLAVTLATRREL